MDADVLKRTLKEMNDRGICLRDLDILDSELADTISNYFLYLSIRDSVDSDEDFDPMSFLVKYDIPLDSAKFLKDNCHKLPVVAKNMDNLRSIRNQSDEEFQLMQKMLIIYLGKDLDWKKVGSMRELFGIRRNLKKKNKAIMIQNLYRMLLECEQA